MMVGDGLPWATHERERWLPTRASNSGGGACEKVGEAMTKIKRTQKNGCHNLDISALKSRFSPHTWTVIESRMLLQIILKDSKSQWSHTQYWHFKNWKTKTELSTRYSLQWEKLNIVFFFLREACRVWVKCSGIPADGLIVVLGNCRTITAEQNH